MEQQFQEQFEALLSKYTELLVGDSSPELTEKVKVWALYTYISKSMPALTKHWNGMYPEGKEEIIKVISEIKELNEEFRKASNKE